MLRGFYQYFALHHCDRKLSWIRHEVQRHWVHALQRRGQRQRISWVYLSDRPWFELPSARTLQRYETEVFAKVIWGAQCRKSARWVLLGETSSRSHARSVRALARKCQINSEAPQRATASRLVSTIVCTENYIRVYQVTESAKLAQW